MPSETKEETLSLNSLKKNEIIVPDDDVDIKVEASPSLPRTVKQSIYLYTKTISLIYSWICLGLYCEVLGPSLPELRLRTGTNYEMIGAILSCRAAGYAVGSMIGGVLNDRFHRRRGWILAVSLAMAGVLTALIPNSRAGWVLALMFFMSGTAHGFHTTGGNPMLAELWKEKASGPFNLMHAGYGFGAAIAPMLVKPFAETLLYPQGRNLSLPLLGNETNATTEVIRVAIQYPYGIVAACLFLCSLIFCTFALLPNPLEEVQFKQASLSELLKKNWNIFYISFMTVTFFTYYFIAANERVFGKFLFSYATEGELRIPNDEAYVLNTLYWISFCLARIIIFVVAFKVPIQWLFLCQILGTLVSAIVLVCTPSHVMVFYVFATCYGTFKSPLFPSGLAVVNRYAEVTGLVVLVVNVGASAGAMSSQYLAGLLIRVYGHRSFLHIIVGTAAGLLVIAGIMLGQGRWHGERFPQKKDVKVNPEQPDPARDVLVNDKSDIPI